jgi:hypothetical protein
LGILRENLGIWEFVREFWELGFPIWEFVREFWELGFPIWEFVREFWEFWELGITGIKTFFPVGNWESWEFWEFWEFVFPLWEFWEI